MVEWSSNFLFAAFILYLVGILFFGGAIKDKRHADKKMPQINGRILESL
ncbi:cytochrome c-type biogenesis protein CcsA/ResC [Mesobacillus boroniphilus JCM 21738]|uniref:Cytochrome c-type biogenesis protein CcsA/ResC n=1 Tax=Mesobacillus boroniphilus JCM 21738 TaxID=1294265 RepID=W4RGL4_9BACI|nr:cytochrome c-type biogenesis protein CcsA/ResC [Mesobacillus boroniphilus JCM 21738]